MPISDRSLRLALASAIAILLIVGSFSYRGMALSSQSDEWVRHTQEVRANLSQLQIAVLGIESSSRGYDLTGQQSYLDSFRAASASLRQHQALIRGLTTDNPNQQRRLPVLEQLAAQIIGLAQAANDVRQQQGLEAAVHEHLNGRGEELTRAYAEVVRQMQDEELRLLAARDRDVNLRLRETRLVLTLGSVLGLLTAAAAAWTLWRDSSRRQAAEEALRDSEDTYRSLIQGIHGHAILMLGPQGKIVSWNYGAEQMTGRAHEDIVGHHFSGFFPPEDIERGRLGEILRLAGENGLHEEHGTLVHKDGTRFMARSTFTALRDRSGALRGFSVISLDLSESIESGAKYRGLLEAAPDAMVVVNQAGEIVLLNLQAEKQFGYRRDELLGQQVKNIIPEGFAERLIADRLRSAEDALAQQIGAGIELTARRKDGTEFPIEIMLSPLESVDGILVTAAIRNISVRRDAEHHLAQMEGRYRGLLEAAPDAMVVVDQGGEIVLLNLQAEKQFGYRRDELLGQPVMNIIPEGFAERLIADRLRSAEDALAQQIGAGIDLTARRKDRSEFPIEIMLSPLESAEGILVTAAIRDISRRKTAEALLLQKVAELNRSNEELAQFAYLASHDLQEPLRMVASYTALLSKRYAGKLDSDADEFIAFAVDGANRMHRLIQDLLAYSRVGSKGKELLDTSSEDALRQALLNLRGAIEESGAQVTHGHLPHVLADEMQLVQLFQNLIGNAIKYQPPGVPQVHIVARADGDKHWIFSVQDNGLGIESQYFERIFGMFQRLHKREEFAGTGVGLAICKKIVERHGGTISVQSQPGSGSTFSFDLAAAA
jgi:PAS domain S-box-containing protein